MSPPPEVVRPPLPASAREREELKYAHRSRRQTAIIRANRGYLAARIAAIEADPVPQPTGAHLEIAPRYRKERQR